MNLYDHCLFRNGTWLTVPWGSRETQASAVRDIRQRGYLFLSLHCKRDMVTLHLEYVDPYGPPTAVGIFEFGDSVILMAARCCVNLLIGSDFVSASGASSRDGL